MMSAESDDDDEAGYGDDDDEVGLHTGMHAYVYIHTHISHG
jgi:hypothetical protein